MKIVMDDAGDIPPQVVKELDITIVPVNIMFGTEEFLSGQTMDKPAFYEKVKQVTAANFPKTSQPTPFQMVEAYRPLIDAGVKEIITVTVGEKLSGTYASAIAAAEELKDEATIHVFDSQAGSAAQGYMAVEAARMARDGRSAEEILSRLAQMRDEMVVYFTIDTLEFAVKGGRVSSMRSAMASLLNIKPLLVLKDGEIVEAGRVRTRRKATAAILDNVAARVGDRPVHLAIIHANAPADAARLGAQASEKFNCTEQLEVDMTIPVAINLGPGALGIVAIPVGQDGDAA